MIGHILSIISDISINNLYISFTENYTKNLGCCQSFMCNQRPYMAMWAEPNWHLLGSHV